MKNSDLLHYKGYTARPEYSVEDRVFYGTILGIDDMVDFQSESAKDLEEQFHKAVDDYLKFCAEIGKEPQKKYSGLFNVRIPPELHRELSLLAQAEGALGNRDQELAARAESMALVGQLEQAISLLSSASSQVKLGSLQQARYDARIEQLRDLQARFRPYQKM